MSRRVEFTLQNLFVPLMYLEHCEWDQAELDLKCKLGFTALVAGWSRTSLRVPIGFQMDWSRVQFSMPSFGFGQTQCTDRCLKREEIMRNTTLV